MNEPTEPISTRDSTTYLYKVFRVLGMDNLNRTWLYIIYSIQLHFTSCVFQPIGFTISYVISSGSMSWGTFLSSLQVVGNVYSVIFKVIVVYFYMPRLRQVDPILQSLDAKIQTKEERTMSENMITFCKRLVLIYVVMYFTYSTTAFLTAITNGHPPFAIYIPYCHWQDSTVKMVVASFIEYYLINVSCVQDVGVDSYPVVFIYIARVHMKMLCLRVEKLGHDLTKTKEDNVRTLVDCIDAHRQILQLVETVRPIISKTIFIQLVATTAVMGITLVNIMIYANLSSGISAFFFLCSITLETLPMCYVMNIFMEEIQNLPTSMFHSRWYDQNKVFRRMMIFFMQNAQKFNNIIAGNILPIEVPTFVSIAKLAFSVYALVHGRQRVEDING